MQRSALRYSLPATRYHFRFPLPASRPPFPPSRLPAFRYVYYLHANASLPAFSDRILYC